MEDRRQPALIVFTKLPIANRAKTRLSPPCSADEAADVAGALLDDTLNLARRLQGRARLVAALETHGAVPPAWPGFLVLPQRGLELGTRLASALHDAGPPALLIAGDAPQIEESVLAAALEHLGDGTALSVIGPTGDGGFWGVGVGRWRPDLFDGVPMTSISCCDLLVRRFSRLGLDPVVLPQVYRDVDRFEDAVAVARELPSSHLAVTVARLIAAASDDRFAPYRSAVDVTRA